MLAMAGPGFRCGPCPPVVCDAMRESASGDEVKRALVGVLSHRETGVGASRFTPPRLSLPPYDLPPGDVRDDIKQVRAGLTTLSR